MKLCENPYILQALFILKVVIKIVVIIVPIIIIIFSMIEISKAIINQNPQEELKKSMLQNSKRIIAGLIILLLPGVMSYIFENLGNVDSTLPNV